jgi:hypothetical protein
MMLLLSSFGFLGFISVYFGYLLIRGNLQGGSEIAEKYHTL